MTMGDENLFAAMTLSVVIKPILDQLEKKNLAAAQSLRAAFIKVEQQHPGFGYDLVKGVLLQAEVYDQVNMAEAMLRMEGQHSSDDFNVMRSEESFQLLNTRAQALKKILSRIPAQIEERNQFLNTIKDIAGAIRDLLDAVNSVMIHISGQQNKQSLEQRKREFVKYSKRFSNTLKDFFKEGGTGVVFMSANYLIHQTNMILNTVQYAS